MLLSKIFVLASLIANTMRMVSQYGKRVFIEHSPLPGAKGSHFMPLAGVSHVGIATQLNGLDDSVGYASILLRYNAGRDR